MKITHQQKRKTNTKSFDFPLDLEKIDALSEILQLCNLPYVYWDLYFLSDKNNRLASLKGSLLKALHIRNDSADRKDVTLKIPTENIPVFLNFLRVSDFEDFTIWSCDTNWEQHIQDFEKPAPFFPFRKNTTPDNYTFYLNYKENETSIICDSDLYPDLTKESLSRILDELKTQKKGQIS